MQWLKNKVIEIRKKEYEYWLWDDKYIWSHWERFLVSLYIKLNRIMKIKGE
jgi:hypothetical protein